MKFDSYNLGNYRIPNDAHGGTCVDVGANVGSFLDVHSGKFSKLHFYEPIAQCFAICMEKTRHSPFITGFNEAVYHTPDIELQLVEHESHHCGSVGLKTDSLNTDWVDEVVGTVKTCNFPRLLERAGGRIDYLKVDCETSEYHFLIDQNLGNVKYLNIEMHWQMGGKKYYELLAQINRTHVTQDDLTWRFQPANNKEALFVRKAL